MASDGASHGSAAANRPGVVLKLMNKRKFSWWLPLSVAAPVVAFIVIHPVLEMGFNDDWGFDHMALVLAKTGQVSYEGWTTPMSLPQVFLGAALIRLFGFSHFLLRLALLPFWAGCGALVYLLGARIGLPSRYCALASLSTTLSPIAIPMGASFHTDITSLAFMLLAVYGGMRGLEPASIRKTAAWLAGTVLAGALAGMTRDIYWAAPVCTIAAVVLLRWRERNARIAGLVHLAAALAGAAASLRWHYTQPTAPPQDSQPHAWQGVGNLASIVVYLCLTTGLMCLPVMICLARRAFALRGWPARIVCALLVTIGSALLWQPRLYFPPWVGNMFTEYGSLYNNQLLIGARPLILHPPVRFLLGVVVLVVSAIFVGAVIQVAGQYRGRLRRAFAEREPLPAFAVLTVPFAAGYIGALVLRNPIYWGWSGYSNLFDRYLLPVAAVAVLIAAGLAFRLGADRTGVAGWAALALMAAFGVANTHDLYAERRAVRDAAEWLTDRGVPRHSVSAGYEYDGWTQLQEKGLMSQKIGRKLPVSFWLQYATDVVVPCYFVVSSPQPGLDTVREEDYRAWLPPYARSVLVQRVGGEFAAMARCPTAVVSQSQFPTPR